MSFPKLFVLLVSCSHIHIHEVTTISLPETQSRLMLNAEEELKINLRAVFGRNGGHLKFVSRDHIKLLH